MSDEVRIADVLIGNRHRKAMGNIARLAASIDEQGLLQPIGITVANDLVFGDRRLRACRDILGWETIPARIVHVSSIVEGEYHENEMREAYETLNKSAENYYHAMLNTILAAMGKGELTHDTAIAVCLAVAGAIASDLDEAGIQLFEQQAASKVAFMLRSKAEYDAATDRGRLQ